MNLWVSSFAIYANMQLFLYSTWNKNPNSFAIWGVMNIIMSLINQLTINQLVDCKNHINVIIKQLACIASSS